MNTTLGKVWWRMERNAWEADFDISRYRLIISDIGKNYRYRFIDLLISTNHLPISVRLGRNLG